LNELKRKEDGILQMRLLSKESRRNGINYSPAMKWCFDARGGGAGKDSCHQSWKVYGRGGGKRVKEERKKMNSEKIYSY